MLKRVRERYKIGVLQAIRRRRGASNSRISFTVDNKQRLKFRKDDWYGDLP